MDVFERFKEIRQIYGPTQALFAKKLGMKQTQIRDIELKKVKVSVEISLHLERLFGVNMRWLLTGDGEMFKNNSDLATGMLFIPQLLEDIIITLENLLVKNNKIMRSESKAKAVRMLYEYSILNEDNKIEEKTIMKVLKIS